MHELEVFLNGEAEKLAVLEPLFLQGFLEKFSHKHDGFNNIVVAVNEHFIPKERYGSTILHNCDRVEILQAFPGG